MTGLLWIVCQTVADCQLLLPVFSIQVSLDHGGFLCAFLKTEHHSNFCHTLQRGKQKVLCYDGLANGHSNGLAS